MRKLKYPVFELGLYPNTWYEGTKLFGCRYEYIKKYGILDDTSLSGDLMSRRIQLEASGEYPLAILRNPIRDEIELVLKIAKKTKIIDSAGNVYTFVKRHKTWILSYPIVDVIHTGEQFLVKFDGTTTRLLDDNPPSEKAKFGLFLQTLNSGEVFIGYSPYNLEERIKI